MLFRNPDPYFMIMSHSISPSFLVVFHVRKDAMSPGPEAQALPEGTRKVPGGRPEGDKQRKD